MNITKLERVQASSILRMILNELIDRNILNLEVYEDEFGCKSFDEITELIARKTKRIK